MRNATIILDASALIGCVYEKKSDDMLKDCLLGLVHAYYTTKPQMYCFSEFDKG